MPRTATVKKLRPQPEFPLDSHPETSLDFTRVKQYLAKHPYRKPVLLVDLDIVRSKTKRFRAALPRVRPHFAVKANPDPRVLKVLMQEGSGFGVNVLSQDQEFLSRACARPGATKFLGHYLDLVGGGSPPDGLLLPASVAAFDCVVTDSRTVGTHLVVMGVVLGIVTSDREPLLYGCGRYQYGTSQSAPGTTLQRVLAWA